MTHSLRRRFLTGASVGFAALLTLGTSVVSNATAATKAHAAPKIDLSSVTLRIDGSPYIMQASGELKGIKYHVVYSTFASGNAGFAALAAGDIDVVGTAEETPIYALANGQPIKVFYVGGPSNLKNQARSASGVAILVPQNSPITSLKQLAGKKVALVADNYSQYMVISALRSVGLSYSQITPVPLASSTAGDAVFASGQVDAISVNSAAWAPLVTQYHARVLAYSNKYIDDLDFLSANASLFNNPSTAAALRDYAIRYGKAEIWQNKHEQAAAAINASATDTPLSDEEIETAYGHDTPLPLSQWRAAAAEQNVEANTLFSISEITHKVNFQTALDPPPAADWPFNTVH